MNILKFFFFALVAVVVSVLMTACGAADLDEANKAIAENSAKPVDFEVAGDGYQQDGEIVVPVKVNFDASEVDPKPAQLRVALATAESLEAKGNEPWVCTGADEAEAAAQVEFEYNYGKNQVKVNGLTLSYEYKGKTYELKSRYPMQVICEMSEVLKEEIEPSYYAETRANYTLQSLNHKMATASTLMVASEEFEPQPEDPELDHVKFNYDHVSFQRNAELSNGVINVFCNNIANFVDIMKDQSQKNAEEVAYTVVNKFNFSAPAMEVNSLNDVVGKTFNFNNGTATVATYSVKATWASADVEGKVMHNGKDYAREIAACRANAKTITFNSASEAVVKFYDTNANDYAEVTVPVKVSEKVTLKNIARNFIHKAFRKNATVSGKNIAVTCDNEASFIKEYSNGSKDNAVKVSYTVVNNFVFNAPAMVVANMDQVLNKTYNFNNGTAVVAGKNVTVSKNGNPVVADIMFDGKNYKNEAPVCKAEVKTIKITSATTATITFEGEGETITAVIPVSIIEAEVIDGEIKALWSTDAYKGRTFARTDLHVLAEKDGAYVVYSRQNRNEAWTITNLSAAEGQAVMASQRPLAWYWLNNTWSMGTVKATKNEAAGYILQYFTLDNQLANNLGKSESTLNGKKFEYPIHGTGFFKDGMWTITYGGTTSYFISNN